MRIIISSHPSLMSRSIMAQRNISSVEKFLNPREGNPNPFLPVCLSKCRSGSLRGGFSEGASARSSQYSSARSSAGSSKGGEARGMRGGTSSSAVGQESEERTRNRLTARSFFIGGLTSSVSSCASPRLCSSVCGSGNCELAI